MKRIVAVLVLVVTLSACTPGQLARYWAALATTERETLDSAIDLYMADRASWIDGRPCEHAFDYFHEAGFAHEQWVVMSRLCARESRGILEAVSPTNDYCWWQINRRSWERTLREAGIIQDSIHELLYDGQKCADAAKFVYDIQGYHAWVTY